MPCVYTGFLADEGGVRRNGWRKGASNHILYNNEKKIHIRLTGNIVLCLVK